MKTASPALIALLHGSTQFLMADLFEFTTVSGAIYRYTSADTDLVWNGNTYSGQGLKIKRSRTRTVLGLEVDTLDITAYPEATDLIGGIPFLQALGIGALDGATVVLRRVFMETWGDTTPGAVWLFSGRISESSMSRSEARLKVKSDIELLNIKMPRNLYQPGCVHTLYTPGCGVLAANYAINGTISAGSTKTNILNGLVQAAGYFDQGKIVFNAGANSGISRTVKTYTPGVTKIALPLTYTPGVGDTFTIYPGCDKQQATCTGKFNNLPNFRAFPYIPIPETAT